MAGLLVRGAVIRAPISSEDLIAAVGEDLARHIVVKVSATARRVSLRVDACAGEIVLVHPARANARSVLAFAASRKDWIRRHVTALPTAIPFCHGMTLVLQDVAHTVHFAPEGRRAVWRENQRIFVSGAEAHAPRRLRDWLKTHAKTVIAPLARTMADGIDRKIAHVSVRDTSSRWGSCSPTGRLSFSWRLILAPASVLTYVIAHEVAHLRHMNHSAAFWRTVEELLEKTDVETVSARHWLRRNGVALHRYR